MTALDVQNLSEMNLGQCCFRQYKVLGSIALWVAQSTNIRSVLK